MSSKGRVLIFTGDGKGKTTAAMGMALRAVGHGMKVKIIQFVKSDSSTGEIAAFSKLSGVDIVQTGRGFLPPKDSEKYADHRQAAQEGMEMASRAIESGEYDLIILDEVCFAVARGLLDEESVVELINRTPEATRLVLTGRGATERLIALADTVTEMKLIKHGMSEGWPAMKGVEF